MKIDCTCLVCTAYLLGREHSRVAPPTLRTLDEWHEDEGDVLWWRFPIVEPPYLGSPLYEDFPDYVTHWTAFATPGAPPFAQRSSEASHEWVNGYCKHCRIHNVDGRVHLACPRSGDASPTVDVLLTEEEHARVSKGSYRPVSSGFVATECKAEQHASCLSYICGCPCHA